MCGVFAFVAHPGRRVNLDRLRRIASITETRGRHAFGFAWIDPRGHLRSFRSAGPITASLSLLATLAADAQALIGHTRFATQGDPADNINNHPHPADGGWLVHNGMLPHYRRLIARHQLAPSSDCDSEVLGQLIETLPGTLPQRFAAAARSAEGRPLALLGLWRSPQRLLAARAGNPLHLGSDATGYYLASYADHLPHAVEVDNHQMLSFRRTAGTIQFTQTPLPVQRPLLAGAGCSL